MSLESDLADQILDHQAAIINYRALINAEIALLTAEQAATGTAKNWNMDGESVDREAWRNGVMSRIKDLEELILKSRQAIIEAQKMLNGIRPWEVRTRMVV